MRQTEIGNLNFLFSQLQSQRRKTFVNSGKNTQEMFPIFPNIFAIKHTIVVLGDFFKCTIKSSPMVLRGDFPLFCEYLLAVTLIGRTVMGSRNCLAFVHSWLPPAPNPTLCLQKLPKVYRIQSTDTKSSTSLIVIQIVTIAFVHPSRCYNPASVCKNAQYIP